MEWLSLISVSHQRIIANAIRQVRHCRSQPFSKSAEMLSTHVHSALHTSLHPSPPITSLHCNRSWHMPAQQKPSRRAGLRQEALCDRQPEGADSALLQAGAPADVSSGSPTAIAFSVTLALKQTSHTHTHTRTWTSILSDQYGSKVSTVPLKAASSWTEDVQPLSRRSVFEGLKLCWSFLFGTC